MKKFRKTALLTAICLTAVFYASCGASNESYNYTAGDNSKSEQSYRKNAASPQIAENAAVAEAEYADDADFYFDEPVGQEEYAEIVENGFINTADENTSTFSIDVDTASYANVRRMIEYGDYEYLPEAVRIEEMINYFNYDYPTPQDDAPFSVTTELSPCPWNENSQLMMIGLQADKIDLSSRAPMNLVFLIDVSGSMYGEDRLGLVQKAVNMLAENLNENDRVSIVTYAGYESVVLEGASGNETAKITDAINNLEAGGSTAGEAGIKKAYEIAQKYFIQGGNNRVLLATDGDLNVGVSSPEELKTLVEKERETGVNLSVLGFGYGNLKDEKLETLADNGNGNYAYIDSELEAQKVLVQEMGGTLYTVAKDVKLQLEFNPDTVQSYRLIGYENRVLANEDFNNDKVDAGEIGAGHSVTALYEIIPAESEADSLLKLAMRYKEPDGNQSMLKEFDITKSASYSEQIQKNEAFAAAVTEFGMLLRNSQYSGTSSYFQIQELLNKSDIQDEYRSEFKQLVHQAYQADLLPDVVENPVAVPVPAETVQGSAETTIPSTELAVQREEDSTEDFTLTAYNQGQEIQIPDAQSFVSLTEMYLNNLERVDATDFQQVIHDAKTNGTFSELSYWEYYQQNTTAPAKMLEVNGESMLVYSIDFLMSENYQYMRITGDEQELTFKMPKVLSDELNLKVKMASAS